MGNKRTGIGRFIHNKWIAMNTRCGKYRNSSSKNKCYKNIVIEFTLEQFKQWCYLNSKIIFSLKRPSIDRIDSNKNYTIDNIQVIELVENIRKKKPGNKFKTNINYKNKLRGIKITNCGTFSSRITVNRKEIHIGTFKTKKEAYKAYYDKYLEINKKEPFELTQLDLISED